MLSEQGIHSEREFVIIIEFVYLMEFIVLFGRLILND